MVWSPPFLIPAMSIDRDKSTFSSMPIREKEMELADRRVFLLPEHRDHWLRVQGENMLTANRE